jgi:DNA repair protein Rad18
MARNRPSAPVPFATSSVPTERIADVKPTVDSEPAPLVQPLTIQCPICSRPFKSEEQVDTHIDQCTGVPSSSQSYNLRPQRSNIPAPLNPAPNISNAFPKNPGTGPLPKVNYAMCNDAKLRALCSDLGLPTDGNRSVLSARHKEFVNLNNANIDRQHPLPQRELLRQSAQWEATQQTVGRKEMKKLNGEEWGKQCKDNFAELAKKARETAKKRNVEERPNGDDGKGMREKRLRSSQEETIA